jgi:hypothetical protein
MSVRAASVGEIPVLSECGGAAGRVAANGAGGAANGAQQSGGKW